MTALDRALIRAFTREPGAVLTRAARLAGAAVVATGAAGQRKAVRPPQESAAVPACEPIDVAAPLAASAAIVAQSISCSPQSVLLHVAEIGVGTIPALPAEPLPSAPAAHLAASQPAPARAASPALRFDQAHRAEGPAPPHRRSAKEPSSSAAVDAALSLPDLAAPIHAERPALGVFAAEPAPPLDQPGPAATHSPAAATGPTRPLSSFVAWPTAEPFHPLLEVDNFIWSAAADQLFQRAAGELSGCAAKLLARAAAGQKVVAVSGVRRKEGRTTIVAALARQLAHGGAQVAVVDADLANPQLAARLGISAQAGWDDVADGQLPLAETLVLSLADRFTLAPLRQPLLTAEAVAGNLRATLAFGTLREHFDLVLVDAGPILLGEEGVVRMGRSLRLDAAYLVYDARDPRNDELAHAIDALEESGITVAGLLENFAPSESTPPGRAFGRSEPALVRTAVAP